MLAKAKSNSVITHSLEGSVLTFHVVGVGELELDLSALAPTIYERAAVHGMVQRIADAAALSRNPVTGKPASAKDKFKAMRELVEYYSTGTTEWKRARVGGSGAPKGGLLKKCLVKMYPDYSDERITKYLEGLSKKDKAALLASPKVAKIAAEIRAEGMDTETAEDLLAGL